MRERESLIARIRQLRRGLRDADERGRAATSAPGQDELRALEARVTHLEQLVEGLQDSVHRESTRLGRRVGELEARIQPGALGRALSDDARERGL
jgi:hypothetical protein